MHRWMDGWMDGETGIDTERLLGLKQFFFVLFRFATSGWCEHSPCPAQQVTQFSRMLSSGWKLAESSSPLLPVHPHKDLRRGQSGPLLNVCAHGAWALLWLPRLPTLHRLYRALV